LKICVSAVAGNLDAQVDPMFGRCPYFVIVDTETMNFEAVPNVSQGALSGAGIQAAQSIVNRGVQMVLTGNMGPNAFQAFSSAGINVVTGVFGTVRDAVEKFKSGELKATAAPIGFGSGGFGMGMGRGGGRGMGFRRWQSAAPFVPQAPAYTPAGQTFPTPRMSKEQEILMLKDQMKIIQQQLDQIKKRLKELEK